MQIVNYKCPHCLEISLSLKEIEEHEKSCRKNLDYTQKCIQCGCLNEDFILTNLRGKGICIHTNSFGSGCPYMNYDDTEIKKRYKNRKMRIRNIVVILLISCQKTTGKEKKNMMN